MQAYVHRQARFDQKAQGPPGSIQGPVSIGSRCQLVHRGRGGSRRDARESSAMQFDVKSHVDAS